jgi:DNA-binding FadR family transcriptional regulator
LTHTGAVGGPALANVAAASILRDPPRSQSHTARVVEDLGRAIVASRQPEGSLLPGDSELMERYAVSRTVLREAVKTLAAKGLLQAKARIGTRVRVRSDWNMFDPDVLLWHAQNGLSPSFLIHLGEMRLALEPEAAALAAERRTAEQLIEIEHWLKEMSQPKIDHQPFVAADLGLHLAVAEAAANPFFRSISTLIEVALDAMLRNSSPVESPGRLAKSISEHRAMVAAIAARKPEAARRAMQVVVRTGIEGAR